MYKNLSIYLGLNVSGLLLGFATLPLITHTISTVEYGKVGIFFALLAFIQPIIGLSTASLVQVKKKFLSPTDFDRFLTNVYIIAVLGFILIEGILQLYHFFNSVIPRIALFALPVICLSRFFINIRLMEFTIEGSPIRFGLSRVGVKLWTFSSLLFFYLIDYSVSSIPYLFIVMVSEFFVLAFLLKKRLKLMTNFKYLCRQYVREIISFGLPIVLATLPLWVINEYGKILLQDVSLHAVGLFTFAKQLSIVYVLVCASVANAFVSNVLSISKIESLAKYFAISLLIYAFLFIAYFYTFILLSPYVVGIEYAGAESIFKVLLIGCFIQVTTAIPSQLFARGGKSKNILMSATIGSVCFLISCHIFFVSVTAMNIAYSYVIGMTVYSLLMWLYTYLGISKNEVFN